ncbi:peptidoglycan-binding protein [Patescibacteria group bacterium]|nr:peptidoglycan-binding protein [Patescibacteria group bacterium]MBU4367482.1 peptidoglycan-binding protein [Patescibacteria group bacterium]MBU4462088.1 peptidoglycan-binding protein [Patescibacteria group bacterium]MCG2700474.1 ABC transporter substrate-binding protein [Candidatus Parcubacteria bacterium]
MKQIKLPNLSQWKRIFKILHKKEKIAFLTFLVLALGSLIFLLTSLYLDHTKIAPAFGGSFSEGVVGQPRFLNPIYGETNDVDRDLIELIFSGLMSYDNTGQIVKDMASDYKISEDGRVYEFTLKDNIFWHDGKPFTSEDIIFTIKTIQNSDYKSPLRANWLEVETEMISEKSFRLKLKSPYNSFLENCTLKIIPKHIWESILPESFALSFYNLQPIGSGPYKFKELRQADTGFIKSITLKSNQNYYQKKPFISEISFKFFEKKEDLIKAAAKKEIDSFSSAYLNGQTSLPKNFSFYSFATPRYFSIFFNITKSDIFADKKIRWALNYAINKQEIIDGINSPLLKEYNAEVFRIVESPILPDFFGYQDPSEIYGFNIEEAKELLDEAGFKENDEGKREKSIIKNPAFQFKINLATGSQGKDVEELQKCLAKDPDIYQGEITGYFGKATKEAVTKFQEKYSINITNFGSVGKTTRAKLNELCTPPPQTTLPLQFTLTTVNQPLLVRVADILKSQLEKIGAMVEIKALDIQDLKPIIKERNYDALLYGEALGMLFDPYPFWHSAQIIDPGLNLSGYENKNADKLLKEGRETLDEDIKKEKYEEFQEILIADAPAVFLYNSSYFYFIDNKIKGIETKKIIDPARRFSNIEDWYLKTRRAWK